MVNANSLNGPIQKADAALTKAIEEANANGERRITFNIDRFFPNEPGTRNRFVEMIRDNGYTVEWCIHPQFGYQLDCAKISW